MAPARSDEPHGLSIQPVVTQTLAVWIVGKRPLYFNRAAEKARRELLDPSPKRKTLADKVAAPKHDPLREYRNSVNRLDPPDYPDPPTRLALPSVAFKSAMATAALDIKGTTKAEIGRLVWVEETWVPVYGVPQLAMDRVVMKGINKAPDIRTRAILPQWCAEIQVTYVTPMLGAHDIGSLLLTAGVTVGVGDFRQERGKGNYGQFNVFLSADLCPDIARLVETGGRAAQDAALERPAFYDRDAEDLYRWYEDRMRQRGVRAVS